MNLDLGDATRETSSRRGVAESRPAAVRPSDGHGELSGEAGEPRDSGAIEGGARFLRDRLGRVICAFLLLSGIVGSASCAHSTEDRVADGATSAPRVEPETLVVFVQPDRSDLARRFEDVDALELELFALYAGLPLRVIPIDEGAPPEVCLTPLVALVNRRGRAIYQGRYLDLDRLENFVRTFRRVAQSDQELDLGAAPVWRTGRMRIVAPLKVTALSGVLPDGLDDPSSHAAFQEQARRAIVHGFEHFTLGERAILGRSDRAFYMDFHPYRSSEGELLVTVELFSQFHCHVPVYSNRGDPIRGRWEERDRVLANAARLLESEVVRQMAQSEVGDGFDPVLADTPLRTWEDLDLPLPASAPSAAASDGPIPTVAVAGGVWVTGHDGANEEPRVLFRFAPPLDHYSGAARRSRGVAEFGATEPGAGWCRFEVPVSSITMGHPDLDDEVRGPQMLDGERHASAWFEGSFHVTPVSFGVQARATLSGEFVMRGIPVALTAPAFFELVLDDQAEPVLLVTGSFSLRLREIYGLEGPDGPDPARDTLLFDFEFPLSLGAGPPRAPG